MLSILLALLFVLVVWWLGTGTVLAIQSQSRSKQTRANWFLVLVAALCLFILVVVSTRDSVIAHLSAFLAAVGLWGCIELSYYQGLVTGTHTKTCPNALVGWERFKFALGTSIWHELVAALIGLMLIVLLWQSYSPTGLYTYLVLWLMRWSSKLNLFFGVPYFNTHWFPQRMQYLKSYMPCRPVKHFFYLSVGFAILAAISLLVTASTYEGPAALTYTLPALLLCLAILEHFFMALPIADSKLWDTLFHKEENMDE